jgi:glycosyltransferase involved in cell wall biosynthesis
VGWHEDYGIKMKIYFDNVDFSSKSGPNSFGYRLAEQFAKMGHNIVGPNDLYDIYLCFIQARTPPRQDSKKILRLDGIWFAPENFEHNNAPIKYAYENVDKVIVQSNFDKAMIEKWYGKRDGIHVIHNGIKKSDFSLVHSSVKRFVCSANWHPQKRLSDNVRLFQKIRQKYPNSMLTILGKDSMSQFAGHRSMLENVRFMGSVTHEECLRIYRQSDYMIHLAWLDHCPNVVVEALSQGCPVICTDSGGTKEIVRDNGIIIPETTPYNFELLDYDSPYELNLSNFSLPEERPLVRADYLDIEKVAQKYLEVFE